MANCFVVQGFGPKQDYIAGRLLNLNASYAVIKDAVESAGHTCVRADEIVHSGTIDIPMYQQLLRADLVIADLSTYNVNAAFELGVRYGLRPHATIIVAEEGFTHQFDVSHIVIVRYKHLGEDLGVQEAKRFAGVLKTMINGILADPKPDSPVYTFLPALNAPIEGQQPPAAPPPNLSPPASDRELLDAALEKISPPPGEPSDFVGARVLLKMMLKKRPDDAFVVQQLALATYKSKSPDARGALQEARKILLTLNPTTTNDTETLGLWGAVHKNLWTLDGSDADLAESITAYQRGFYLKQDHYNGVNYAFLLELRSLDHARKGADDEAIADRVLARRTRLDVLRYATPKPEELAILSPDKRYWLLASMWETCAGLGRTADATVWEQQARALGQAQWMLESTEGQIARSQQVRADMAAALAPAGTPPPAEPAPASAATPAAPAAPATTV